MTSGRSSPPPSRSPSMFQRPFLMRAIQAPKKTVDFENLPPKNDFEDTKSITDPENLTLITKGSSRLTEPRMSLFGKPLLYNASRGDANYRRIQSRVYNFLERPSGVPIFYHILVFLMVFTCLLLSVFSTIEPYEEISADILTYMESFVVVWFAIEFGLRLWSAGCRSRYQGYIGRLKFLKCAFCLIDIVTIVASIVVLILARSRGQVFATSALRGLRFFQILRMVRMDRRGGTWKLLGSVVYAHRQELVTTLYIGFLGWFFASFLVFLAEKDVNKKFNNFAQALWWGVITLCTVGYGDMVPETWQGKMIASFCSLLGISFFALPAGILGSGFALKVQQQQRQKHMIGRRQPAAILIQSVWRCYAADEQSLSVATWKIHQVPLPSPSSRVSSSFRYNTSFVSKLPTIRRHKSRTSNHTPTTMHKGPPKQTFLDINSSAENLGTSGSSSRNLNPGQSEDSVAETNLTKRHSDDEEEVPRYQLTELTSQHKEAIRAIRKMKYFVARKKFKEALKPYDVKDVMEQYASGHADISNRVKNLQFRLDQILGKQGSKAKDEYASNISLASRVVKVERQVEDIESKLDQLLELYIEDRKRLFAPSDVHESNVDKSLGSDPINSNLTTSATVTKPKPILVTKRSSKPTSPKQLYQTAFVDRPSTSVARKPMHRGYSDVGSRTKKRVTLRSVSSNYVSPSRSPPHDDEVVIIVPTLNVPQMASSGDTFCVSGFHNQEKELGSSKSIAESSEIGNSETCPPCPLSEHSTEILITPTTLESSTQNDDSSLALSKSEPRKYV